MPCTLEPWEIAYEERLENKEVFGVELTDERLTEEVACQVVRLLRKHKILKEASPLVKKWARLHAQKDRKAGR